MSKLVLIDGNAILHRAYHALPPLTTRRGEPINAVYGFVLMLLKVIQDLKPTHIAVCFDVKEPTFRHEEFEEYQAHRPEMDKELDSQFPKAKAVAKAMNIPIYEKAGFEADDIIGTLANKTQKKLDGLVIVTGDKDILQLVNEKIKVFLPTKGVTQGKLYNRKEVVEKLGIEPEQIADYKALVGDPSDNYPGVKGIGPKTAEKLLKKYKTLEKIYKNLDDIDRKTAEKLKNSKDDALLYQHLARIVTDVDIKTDLEKAASWKVDSSQVFDLFKTFGFKTLTKRVKKVREDIDKEKQMTLL